MRTKILVLDLELTCWEGQDQPAGQVRDIIEIGYCFYDTETGGLSGETSIMVKPERSSVSPFCTQLTGITQEAVDAGVSFAQACAIIKEDARNNNKISGWGSWGDSDRRLLERQCRECNVPYPLMTHHWNLKHLFSMTFGLAKELGLKRAIAKAGLSFKGVQHSGKDDAVNAAILFDLVWKQWRAAPLPAWALNNQSAPPKDGRRFSAEKSGLPLVVEKAISFEETKRRVVSGELTPAELPGIK